jgi:hypothetical protein
MFLFDDQLLAELLAATEAVLGKLSALAPPK